MKNKFFISILIFLILNLQIFPCFAIDLNAIPVWSDTSEISIPTAAEPSFDIASEAGILIELTTRKSII